MKYIITCDDCAIVFDPVLSHADVAHGYIIRGYPIRAAGECEVWADMDSIINVSCSGRSVTLKNVISRPLVDAEIIERLFTVNSPV